MRTYFAALFCMTAVGWLVYELIALFNAQPGDTITEIVAVWSGRYPIVVLALGIVLGHLFWPRQ